MTPLDKGSKAMFGKFGKLTAILLFALMLTSTLGAAPFQVEEETAAKKADLTALVEQLKSKEHSQRESAQEQLAKLGSSALPELREALKGKHGPEVRYRLKSVIKQLSQVNWSPTFEDALATARKQNKMVVVFSTIGEVDGFS